MGHREGNRGPPRRLGGRLESNTQESSCDSKGRLPKVFKKLRQNNPTLKTCFHYSKPKASLGD